MQQFFHATIIEYFDITAVIIALVAKVKMLMILNKRTPTPVQLLVALWEAEVATREKNWYSGGLISYKTFFGVR